MAKFSVTIAELKNRITIAHKENVVDEDNVITGSKYVEDFKLWAKANKEQIYKETDSAYQENYIETCSFTVRYTNKVTYDHVILFDGKIWRIVDLDNIQYSDRWLRIRCKRVENDVEDF